MRLENLSIKAGWYLSIIEPLTIETKSHGKLNIPTKMAPTDGASLRCIAKIGKAETKIPSDKKVNENATNNLLLILILPNPANF